MTFEFWSSRKTSVVEAATGDLPVEPRAVLSSRPVLAATLVLTIVAIVHAVPGLRRWKAIGVASPTAGTASASGVMPAPTVGEATLTDESSSDYSPAELQGSTGTVRGPIAADSPPIDARDFDAKKPPRSIEDPSGKALDGFFAALARTARHQAGAITRILYFGDSIVASDYVTSTLRQRLQDRFGDAGHGFTLIANAWPSYFHDGVSRYATGGWKLSRIVGPVAGDGWHGLGGGSFWAHPNILARIGTAKRGEVGRRVSRFVLAYVERPQGGTVRVRIDGNPRPDLDTEGPIKRFATAQWRVPDGPHEIELQTLRGTSRFFGIVLERDVPGVVLDAIGIQGARIRFLDNQDDEHFREQLKWRNPDLVVYEFGANESADGYAYPMSDYHRTMKAVIAQQRNALPEASCLIVGAMDRASGSGTELKSLSIIPHLVAEQRKVAAELGCAFFDTYQAMGGRGSMPTWVRRGLGQSDLTHPTAVGSEVLGAWLFRALMQASRGQLVESK